MRDMTVSELDTFYIEGMCPWCRNREIFEGPQGGMMQNIECATCGIKLNVSQSGFRYGQVIAEPDFPAIPKPKLSWWQRLWR